MYTAKQIILSSEVAAFKLKAKVEFLRNNVGQALCTHTLITVSSHRRLIPGLSGHKTHYCIHLELFAFNQPANIEQCLMLCQVFFVAGQMTKNRHYLHVVNLLTYYKHIWRIYSAISHRFIHWAHFCFC